MQTFIHYIMGFYACLQIKQAVCVISYGALSSIVYTYTNTENDWESPWNSNNISIDVYVKIIM